MPRKKFSGDWEGVTFNLLIYTMLSLAVTGIIWLSLNDVPAGQKFTTLFLGSIGLLMLGLFALDESNRSMMQKIIKLPFSVDLDVGVGSYLLGFAIPIVGALVITAFGFSFTSIAQVMVPLATEDINEGIAQSFSIANFEASEFWQLFVTVFTAGTIEEFVFGFVWVLNSIIIAILVFTLIFKQVNMNDSGTQFAYTALAIIISGLVFGGAHTLNNTYTTTMMFLVAIGFRMAMNSGIYFWKLFFTFTVGYHQSNNLIWWIGRYGFNSFIAAISTLGGIIIGGFFILMLFYAVRRFPVIVEKMRRSLSSDA